jgi:DNA-binding NarL/FixJ family response regulator
MAVRIAVVDSNTLSRLGMSTLVADQPDLTVVAQAGSAADATQLVAAHRPNVVIIDSALADRGALRLARELRDRHATLGIVVLAGPGEDEILFQALDTGASAFVEKTAAPGEILGAIRHAAVAATSFIATGLVGALSRRRDNQSRFALSPREHEVLKLLRDNMSIPAVARTLYVSTSTAKTYVSRLYDKLGASSRAQALMIALSHGLIDYDTLSSVG